jgi:hypothetical protein
MARKGKKLSPDQFAPKIAEGLTEGPLTPEEARREFPVSKPPAVSYLHMTHRHARGEPYAAMVIERNGVPIQEPNTGRWMEDVDVIITEEERQQILAGYRCLRCKEPFELAYPASCSVCGYEVSERQALDAELELEGARHVGPSKPLTEYMQELELRQEKALFEQRIREGGSRGRHH